MSKYKILRIANIDIISDFPCYLISLCITHYVSFLRKFGGKLLSSITPKP